MRPCRPSELQAVIELWAAARCHPASLPDTPSGVERLLNHSWDALLVAELDGEIVGALITAWDGWRGNMYRLAVLPSHRRRRIALALVREGERRLLAKGSRRITALLAHEDDAAVGLWTMAGYSKDDEIGRFVRNL